ncbi:hypothetical protein BMS3Abin11_00759 [bacterium BMS3Abin11]|nr:hypothetical protein BMS3Abin11_00759 [bacterium BMS3Abin11]
MLTPNHCGRGQNVQALKHGYDISGVDNAEDTIRAVQKLFPDLPIQLGDVSSLKVGNGYYQAYISLGIIEHRYEDPEPFL